MAFVLNISHAPLSALARAPLQFACAASDDIKACFFQSEAVALFSENTVNPDLKRAWLALLAKQNLKALCCSAAASEFLDLDLKNLETGIEIVGMGELISLSQQAKIICFGDP